MAYVGLSGYAYNVYFKEYNKHQLPCNNLFYWKSKLYHC